MNNPGFEALRDVFMQFAAKYNPDSLKAKMPELSKNISREIAKQVIDGETVNPERAAFNAVRREFPRSSIETFVSDVYDTLRSDEFVEGLSMMAQNLDASQLQGAADQFVQNLKNPQTLNTLAMQLKTMSSQMNFTEFRTQMRFMFGGSNMPPAAEQIFDSVMVNLEPIFDQAKDMSVPEIADMLGAGLDSIPFDDIFDRVLGVAQFATPETVRSLVDNEIAKLPTPSQVGDMYDDLYMRVNGQGAMPPVANQNKPVAQPKPEPKKPGKGGKIKF